MAKSSGGSQHPQASIISMVLIRLFLGMFFLYSVSDKVGAPAHFIAQLKLSTAAHGPFVVHNTWAAFGNVLHGVVAPHAALFGWLIIVAEILVGVLLILGLLTRLAALIGLIVSTLFLLASMHLGISDLGYNAAFIMMELCVLIAAPGRTWGIDAAIARRTKLKLLW